MLRARFTIGIFAALLLVSSMARGEVVVVSTVNSTAPIAFSEDGTFVDAGNFNGPNAVDVRGTNLFVQKLLIGNPPSQTFVGLNGVSATVATSAGVLAPADLRQGAFTDEIYLTEIWSTGAAPMSLNITGLDAAKSYLVQLPHGESRQFSYNEEQTFTVTDSGGNSVTSFLNFGGPSHDPYALISVRVSGTTSLLYDMPGVTATNIRGASFNGYTIRELPVVPTPSACASGLALIGGLGFIKLRKRR